MSRLDYPLWLDYLEYFLEGYPDAEDAELFKRFPELKKSSKILIAAQSHIIANKNPKVTKEWLRHHYPEIYGHKEPWWIRIWKRRT